MKLSKGDDRALWKELHMDTLKADARYDFTRPGTYPRSGRDLLGGVVYLARAIDNIIDNAISFSPPGVQRAGLRSER